jgi:hypothetical protein
MLIDYTKMVVFDTTKKYLEKRYSRKVLDKYFSQLAFLYQSGFVLECNSDDETIQQIENFNSFKSDVDFEDLKKAYGNIKVSSAIGDKIITDSLYSILTATKWAVDELSVINQKKAVSVYDNIIRETVKTLVDIMSCKCDSVEASFTDFQTSYANIYNNLVSTIDKVNRYITESKKVMLWNSFVDLRKTVFKMYLLYNKLTSGKKNVMSVVKASNLNDEIYGSSGGFNPITGTVKAVNGSAVYELFITHKLNLDNPVCLTKMKVLAKSILDDADCYTHIKTAEFDDDDSKERFLYLYNWYKNQQTDNEKARHIIELIELNGILSLLCLKYQLTILTADRLNIGREKGIITEFTKIVNYCNVKVE